MGEEQPFLKVKTKKKFLYPLPIDIESWLLDVLYNFELWIDWFEKQFLQFCSLKTPFPKFGHNWILTWSNPDSCMYNLFVHAKFHLLVQFESKICERKTLKQQESSLA